MHTGVRSGSAAAQVLDRILAGGERFWRHDDFGGLPASAVATTLSRLAHEGELQRVRMGVYFRPRVTVLGPSLPGPGAAASSLRVPLHAAGLSAANVLGLTTQNPARREYATPATDPPTALRTSDPGRRGGCSARVPARPRDDLRSVELGHGPTPQRPGGDRTRFARLVRAAQYEPPRVRAMLGALGELAGAPPRDVQTLRDSLNPLSKFDFGALSTLPNARSWQAK